MKFINKEKGVKFIEMYIIILPKCLFIRTVSMFSRLGSEERKRLSNEKTPEQSAAITHLNLNLKLVLIKTIIPDF